MLFAASFGEAVSNPDPWQLILGSLIPLAMAWLGGRFPVLLTILKLLNVNIQPSPAPGPAPEPTPAPVPDKLTIADLVKALLELLARRKQASLADDEALKVVAEALAVK
jgi:hypothetical protein